MKTKIVIIIALLLVTISSAQTQEDKLTKPSLTDIPTISVTIGGDFPVTGTFLAFLSERTDQFVTRMYNEARQKLLQARVGVSTLKELETEFNNYSLRGIVLKRDTGNELKIDLQKFRVTGDFKYNPYLKNDDIMIFPAYDIERNFFTVSGAVNKPGLFYFVEGDSLKDAIELAMGVNKAFENIGRVCISRLSYDGNSLNVDTVDINSDIKLNRGDQIRVLATETRRRNNFVSILGEVKNPGTFPITNNSTRLIDIIKSAGGFTENASLKRAKIYSKNTLAMLLESEYNISLTDQPILENKAARDIIVSLETNLMYRMSNVYPEDAPYFFLENQLRVLIESSSFDFTKISDPQSTIANYTLQNGDIIVIPAINKSVYVFGQVANPGYIPIVEGKDYKYYIQQAGGLGELAVEDEIMVIKGGTRAWVSPIDDNVVLEEGDYIYVPKERLKEFRSYAAEYSIYIQILSSIATVVLLIITAFK